jgi:hypothetical protein
MCRTANLAHFRPREIQYSKKKVKTFGDEPTKYRSISGCLPTFGRRCTIEDYINNLTPRDDPVNSPLYASLSRLFERSLPYIESVDSYVHAVRSSSRNEEEAFEDDGLSRRAPLNLVDTSTRT